MLRAVLSDRTTARLEPPALRALAQDDPAGARHVAGRLPPALDTPRFDPFNRGRRLRLVGTLNRLRDFSQAAWSRRRGGAIAQGRADAQLELVRGRD
jgi:hypothetical protein